MLGHTVINDDVRSSHTNSFSWYSTSAVCLSFFANMYKDEFWVWFNTVKDTTEGSTMKLTLLVLLCGLKSMSKFLRLCKNFQSCKDCLGSGLTCQVCDGPNGQCNTPSENYNVTTVVCPEENDACLYKAISMCIPRVPTSFGWDFIKKN